MEKQFSNTLQLIDTELNIFYIVVKNNREFVWTGRLFPLTLQTKMLMNYHEKPYCNLTPIDYYIHRILHSNAYFPDFNWKA